MEGLLHINPKQEKERIVTFLKKTFAEQQINKAVIGVFGGIDSTTSFYLLKEVLPPENIFVAHLYYFQSFFADIEPAIHEALIPSESIYHLSIKEPIDAMLKLQDIGTSDTDKVRIGNISARMRMIILFDLAKKVNGLVCGTENKSENLLSYFTRFGDQASDIEPIEHLYKTQIYQLAKSLGAPEKILQQNPTAGLWQGQTDEGEFGFTYQEADQVLFLHLEKGLSVDEIEAKGLQTAKKILDWREKNLFKHQVPYTIT